MTTKNLHQPTLTLPATKNHDFSRFQLAPFGIGILMMVGVIIFLLTHPSIHPDIIFEDMMSFVDFKSYVIPPYLSAFSFLGFVFWFFGSGFCILTVLIIRAFNEQPRPRILYYLATLGGLGLVMGLDDMLRLHENIIPTYLGIPENAVLAFYGLYFVCLLVAFRKEIMTHNLLFLVMFYGLFGFSQVVDVLSPEAMQLQGNPTLVLLEEVPKFLALVAYASYCLYFCYYEVANRLEVKKLSQ